MHMNRTNHMNRQTSQRGHDVNRSKSMGWLCGVALCLGTAGAAAQTVDTTLKVASLPLTASDRIDSFIVHYKPGMRAPSASAVQAFTAARSLVAAKGGTISTNALRAANFQFARATASGGMVVRAGKPLDGTAAMALMKEVAADPNVESVEPNVRMHAFRDLRPADATTGT